ncbi:type II toxin-antitoxin system HicA family toxin [Candidatus Acetothermia bacterium]|nr:type II toxin-antitoxin system HicA family toxin [Candidatus Acetothermia bacterium]
MARLTPLKSHEVMAKLRQLGFIGPFSGGKHRRMIHPQTGKIIPIPVHRGKDVSVGLIREIIRELGISREEWLQL